MKAPELPERPKAAAEAPRQGWRAWSRALAWAALAGAGALAPAARHWLAGLTILHRDQTGQYAPLRWLAGSALREGRLPLWNPYCATGMPYFAETTHGVLHPLSVAVAFLFPGDGLDPLVGAWIASAAAGAYFLARALGASRAASLVAAFAYGLSGWTLSMTSNLIGLAGAGSAPWVVAGLRVAGRDRGVVGFACGAGAVAAGALAGDVQALSVATLLGLLLALEAGGWRGLLLAVGAVANGAMLAGIQLVPSWSFLQHTDRVFPLPPEEKNQWDLAPWRLVELAAPGFFTLPSDGMGPAPVYLALGHPTFQSLPLAESVFVGAAVLLLAAAGSWSSRTGRVLLGGVALVAWFAMGRHLGARALQDSLPIAAHWRYGEKFLTVLMVCISALAALGADHLLTRRAGARRWARAAAVGAGMAVVLWLLLLPGEQGGLLDALGAPRATQIRDHLLAGIPHAALALLAVAGALWLATRGRTALAGVALVVTVWSAGAASSRYALRPGSIAARLETEPPRLRAASPGPRVLGLGGVPARLPRPGWDAIDERNFDVAATYSPNTNARRSVDAFGVDTGLIPIRWLVLTDALQGEMANAARRYAVTHLILPPLDQPEGARWGGATQGGSPEVADTRTGMVFWAIPHRDWAVFPQQAQSVPGPEAAVEAIARLQREGRRTAVVEVEGEVPTASGHVLQVSRGRERVEVVAEADGESLLVVNDAFWPGWRAFIDGQEVPIFPADVLVRAVPWPAGRHTLVMQYEPVEVRYGLYLSLAGLGALGGVGLLLRRRKAGRS